MNSVDQIIRYLSGELDKKEARELEEAVKTDPKTKETFDQVSEAYKLVGDQLRKRDEAVFSEKLRRIMDREREKSPSIAPDKRIYRRLAWSFAATIALLAGIFIYRAAERNTFLTFYHPEKDPLLLAMQNGTRGMEDSLAVLLINRQNTALWTATEHILSEDPQNNVAILFNLLAALELGKENIVLMKEWKPDQREAGPVDQAIAWYRALACLKSDRPEEAENLVNDLAARPGPYQKDAKKLLRMLIK